MIRRLTCALLLTTACAEPPPPDSLTCQSDADCPGTQRCAIACLLPFSEGGKQAREHRTCQADVTPPTAITASLTYTPAADNPLGVRSVTAATAKTRVELIVGVDEPLASPPALEASGLDFQLMGTVGDRNYQFIATVTDTTPEDQRAVRFEGVDLAGNCGGGELSPVPALTIDRSAPAAPDTSASPDGLVFEAAPSGKDGAAQSFAVRVPRASLEADVTQLVFTAGTVRAQPCPVTAGTTALRCPLGGFADRVEVVAIDGAGNISPSVPVLNVERTFSFSDSNRDQHTAAERPRQVPALRGGLQTSAVTDLSPLAARDGRLLTLEGRPEWRLGGRWSDDAAIAAFNRPSFSIPLLASDPERGVVALLGGGVYTANAGPLAQCELDETGWSCGATPDAPSNRSAFAVAYDTRRGALFLFGGGPLGVDFFMRLDGRWQRLTSPSTQGTYRDRVSMTYDAARDRLIIYGGANRTANEPVALMWTWNEGFAPLQVLTDMPHDGLVVYDAARQAVVLHAGGADVYALTDHWEKRSIAGQGPSATSVVNALVYDTAQQLVVLATHEATSTSPLRLFELDGATWHDRGDAPFAGDSVQLVYDAPRERLIAHRSYYAFTPTFRAQTDTWQLPRSHPWSLAASSFVPQPRAGAAAAYDPQSQRTLFHGGNAESGLTNVLADVSTWNGEIFEPVQWTSADGGLPAARTGAAFGPGLNGLVLNGGNDAQGHPLADTWSVLNGFVTLLRPGGGAYARHSIMQTRNGETYRFRTGGVDALSSNGTWTTMGSIPPAVQNIGMPTLNAGEAVALTAFPTQAFRGPPSGTMASLIVPMQSPDAAAFDSCRGRQTLVTYDGTALEYDGTSWRDVGVAHSLPQKKYRAAAFDTHRCRLVVFGGGLPQVEGAIATTSELYELASTDERPGHVLYFSLPRLSPTDVISSLRIEASAGGRSEAPLGTEVTGARLQVWQNLKWTAAAAVNGATVANPTPLTATFDAAKGVDELVRRHRELAVSVEPTGKNGISQAEVSVDYIEAVLAYRRAP